MARILVVDDEVMVTGYLQELLESFGHHVTLFNDPREALARFERAPAATDLLITDQSMPNMSGMEMIEKMQTLRPELPFILCSGFSETNIEAQATASSNGRFLNKPYKSRDLLALIEKLLPPSTPA